MNNVYKISTTMSCYSGFSLVAAPSIEEANNLIKDFKHRDSDNICDSWGYDYVGEDDIIEHLTSDVADIIYYGIYYRG